MSTSFEPRIVLRPRSLDETFDLALAYLRISARDFIKVFVIFCAGAAVIVVGTAYALDLDWGQRCAVALVVVAMMERMVTVYAGRHLFQNPAQKRAALKAVLKRSPLVSIWSVVSTGPLLIMLADIDDSALMVLGIFCLTFWPFVLASHIYLGEAAFLEQLPAGRAMKRARVLVTYRFGRALGMVVAQSLVRGLFVLSVAFGTTFLIEFVLQFKGVPESVQYWAGIGGYILSGPYVALVRLFDYVDARTRREGWDIQVRFNAIAQRAKEERASRLAA
jgi:hypothetical protein